MAVNDYRTKDILLIRAIAASRSLSAAARELGVSNGEISKRLDKLEIRTGQKLVHRHTRPIVLTKQGNIFLASALRVQEEIIRMESAFLSHEQKQSVTLVMDTTLEQRTIADLSFRLAEFNDIAVAIHHGDNKKVIHMIAEGQAEVGITTVQAHVEGLRFFPLNADDIVLLTPLTHRLATYQSVSTAQLIDFEFIGPPADSDFSSYLHRYLGPRLHYKIQADNYDLQAAITAICPFPAILPERIAQRHLSRSLTRIVKISDIAKFSTYVCVTDKSSMTEAAITVLRFLSGASDD